MTAAIHPEIALETADHQTLTHALRSDGRWIAGLVFAGVFFVLYLQQIEPFFFLRDDNAAYHLPAYVHNARALTEHGELAQLNLHQNNGGAHLSVGQTAVLYPPPYVAVAVASLLGDLRWTLDLEVGFHLLLAAVGMFLLVRNLGGRRPSAAAAALLLLTAPFVLFVGRGWVIIAHGAAFVPWCLLLFLRLLERPGWQRAATLAVATSFFFLAGYPQLLFEAAVFQGLLLGATWLLRPDWRRRSVRAVAYLAAAAMGTAVLSAPLLLPMLAQASSSARGFAGISPTLFVKWSADPVRAARAQLLLFDGSELFHASSAIYYVGIPLLLAAVVGTILGGRRLQTLALVACLAFLSTTTLWGLLYGLPLVSSFRWPVKHYLPFLVFLIPLGAPAFDRLLERRPAVAWTVLAATLAIPVLLPWSELARRAPSPIALQQPIDIYAGDRLLAEADADARVASFRTLGSTGFAPQLLTHNFATLFGFRQVGGYEPLMSRRAVETTVATDFATFNVVPETVDRDRFRRLGLWGAATVLAPTDPRLRQKLPATGAARLAASNGGLDLYRNLLARPIVENLALGRGLDATYTTNRVRFQVDGDGAAVRVAVTPLPGWSWTLDGESMGRPDEHPAGGFVVGVPPGRHQVRLRYRTPRLDLGLAVGALGWLALLTGALISRRRVRHSVPT